MQKLLWSALPAQTLSFYSFFLFLLDSSQGNKYSCVFQRHQTSKYRIMLKPGEIFESSIQNCPFTLGKMFCSHSSALRMDSLLFLTQLKPCPLVLTLGTISSPSKADFRALRYVPISPVCISTKTDDTELKSFVQVFLFPNYTEVLQKPYLFAHVCVSGCTRD